MRYSRKIDLGAVPEFAAGFMYNLIGGNNLPEFKACYTSTQPLFGYVKDAMNNLEELHILKAIVDI